MHIILYDSTSVNTKFFLHQLQCCQLTLQLLCFLCLWQLWKSFSSSFSSQIQPFELSLKMEPQQRNLLGCSFHNIKSTWYWTDCDLAEVRDNFSRARWSSFVWEQIIEVRPGLATLQRQKFALQAVMIYSELLLISVFLGVDSCDSERLYRDHHETNEECLLI